MTAHRFLVPAAIVILLSNCASVANGKFASFDTRNDDGANPTFNYSSAAATPDDPVVITAVGRALTRDDRKYRVDLQKYWLSVNVPSDYEFLLRTQDQCGLMRPDDLQPNDYPRCDHYYYRDPKSGKEHDYYFYLNSWPH